MKHYSYWTRKAAQLHQDRRDLSQRKGDPIENIRKIINSFYTDEYIEYGTINHNSLLVARIGIAVREKKLIIMVWP